MFGQKQRGVVSNILCPFHPSICNNTSVQATLCLSHSSLQSWSATTMQGFPSPGMGWRRDKPQAVIPLHPSPSSQIPAQGCSPGTRGVSLLVSGRQLCWSSLAHHRGGQQRARQWHFRLPLLLSKSIKDRIKPFHLTFSEQLKGRVLQSWAEEPYSLKPLIQEIFTALQRLVPRHCCLLVVSLVQQDSDSPHCCPFCRGARREHRSI